MEKLYKKDISDSQIITFDDVMESMIGLDEDGDIKTAIYIIISEATKDENEDPKIIKHLQLHNVFVADVGLPGEFAKVDLEFKLMSNTYMESFCEMVTMYQHMVDEGKDFCFSMQVVNLHDNVEYIADFECPVICLQGYSGYSKEPTLLQVVFPLDRTYFYKTNYKLSEIRAEVGRMLDEEESAYDYDDEYDYDDYEYEEEDTKSDIDEQVKESYGLNNMGFFKDTKESSKKAIDDHIHLSNR